MQPKSEYRLSNDPIIRSCGIIVAVYLGALIFGGIGVYLIVFGLSFFFTRVFTRTPLGQAKIGKFFGIKPPEQAIDQPHSIVYKIATTSIRLIFIGFYLTMSIFLIWTEIKLLLSDGFLNQNLIYIFFFKFR